jgi:hypothetical protein
MLSQIPGIITKLVFGLWLLLFTGCGGPVIPVENPFRDYVRSIKHGQTTRGEIHNWLGTPSLTYDEWDIEVYEKSGAMIGMMGVIPYPETDAYYLVVTYKDSGLVDATEITREHGDSAEVSGFVFEPNRRILYAPERESAMLANSEAGSDECVLFVFPDMRYHGLVLDHNRYHGDSRGYFRLVFEPGERTIACTKQSGVAWGMFDIGLQTFACHAGMTLYTHLPTTQGQPCVISTPTETPSIDLHTRRLIILPDLPHTKDR